MKELALHILDIIQNSISAHAKLVQVIIEEDDEADVLRITIIDDGCGMDEEFLQYVTSPFATTRTTRKVGLGIPMFRESAISSGGCFSIDSKKGEGTSIVAQYRRSHIDRPPLGDMAETMLTVIVSNPETPDFLYRHTFGDREYVIDTRLIRQTLGEEIPLNMPSVMAWIKEDLQAGLQELFGGVRDEIVTGLGGHS